MRAFVKTSRPPRIALAASIAWLALASAAPLRAATADAPALPVRQTLHYVLHTDLADDLADDLSRRLDTMFDEYARRLAEFGPASVPRQDVYVFARKIDYMKFVGDRLPNTGGMFLPSRGCLAAYLEGQGRDALRRTLQHEAFHQFAHATISPNLPVWINEGMAQVFEEGIYTGRRFIVEQVPARRLRQLKDDMDHKRLMPFEPFMAVDHGAWALTMRDRDKGATQYNQAWAMVHFLVYATDARTRRPMFRERFFAMLQQVKQGIGADAAFRANFGANFAAFQSCFVEYARGLTPTPQATYVENAEVLSDLLTEMFNVENRRFTSLADFRTRLERGRYQLQYSKGAMRWTSDPNVGVYFRDAEGRELPATMCGLIPNPLAPLPDLILRPPSNDPSMQLEYRARFFLNADGKADREIVVRAF